MAGGAWLWLPVTGCHWSLTTPRLRVLTHNLRGKWILGSLLFPYSFQVFKFEVSALLAPYLGPPADKQIPHINNPPAVTCHC